MPGIVCPLRMLAAESDWETIRNVGETVLPQELDPSDGEFPSPLCLRHHCAWWDGNNCIIYNFGHFLVEMRMEMSSGMMMLGTPL